MIKKLSFLFLGLLLIVFAFAYIANAQENIAVNKSYTLAPNNGDFFGDNGTKLTNGVYIVSSSDTSGFVGWDSNVPTITVDLGSVFAVNQAELYVVNRSDISGNSYFPDSVAFSYSSDGVTFSALSTVSSHNLVSGSTHVYSLSFGSVDARYFRFLVNKPALSSNEATISEVMVYSVSVPVSTQLAFVQQPTDVVSGSVITPMVTVQLKDSSGNNVSNSGVAVDMSMSSGTGILTGATQQVTDSTGLASFSDLTVDTPGSKILTASSVGLTSAVSNAFNVSIQSTPTPPAPTPTPTPVVNLTPSMAGVIYGRVLNKSLSPFSGVKVEYVSTDYEYTGKNPVITDVDGYYFFDNCDTSYPCTLEMTLKGYGSITKSISGTSTGVVNRLSDEVLVKGNSGKFKLSGSVKDVFGSPVDFVRVTAKSGGLAYVDYTDLSGGYSFSDMLSGTYTVNIKRSGYYSGRYKYSNSDSQDGVLDMVIIDRAYEYYAK